MSINCKLTCNYTFHVVCHISITGNTHLHELTDNTLRKLGLCEDHFLATSFSNATKVHLNRNAVPVAYKNAGSSANEENVEIQMDEIQRDIAPLSSNENMVLEEQISQECVLQTYRPATLLRRDAVPVSYENAGSFANEENVEMNEIERDITPFSPNKNMILEEEKPQECALRTHRSATLNFEMLTEKEDEMEWMRLEPPIRQNVERKENTKRSITRKGSTQRNNSEIKAKIRVLRIENLNLRKKNKTLKISAAM